jgi:hypothetical protein
MRLLERKININEKTGELVLESMEIHGEALKNPAMLGYRKLKTAP